MQTSEITIRLLSHMEGDLEALSIMASTWLASASMVHADGRVVDLEMNREWDESRKVLFVEWLEKGF